MKKQIKEVADDVRASSSEKSNCPKHCRRWTYTTTASFAYLEHSNEANILQSKIHVYYGDFNHRIHEQVKKSQLIGLSTILVT